MEPDEQPQILKDDQEKLQTPGEGKIESESSSVEPTIPEASSTSEPMKENSVEIQATPEVVPDEVPKGSECDKINQENKVSPETAPATSPVENEDKENARENDLEGANKESAKSHLPSFPGTVTKSVPGSNDVKIEIDSNSLLDRVILYSLKNTVVDNSRLDAAKNKYMLNRGNITSNCSSNSNGSDSNSSSKSVEKLIEEFKGGCSKSTNENPPAEPSTLEPKSDISIESSNGAETCVKDSNRSPLRSDESIVIENHVIAKPADEIESMERNSPAGDSTKLPEHVLPKPSAEMEALDFRERIAADAMPSESTSATLDLSVPHRDEKSVPPIKRNLALYVGLPDFSKQIFTAPSISRPTAQAAGPPKINNPDISAVSRGAPELQMRHPDFSKSFAKADAAVTPSNFPEIVRKNNYISDLQLKPPSSAAASSQSLPTPTSSSSYKIDYRSSAVISQKIQEAKPEQPSTSHTVYPNMKKEGINAYNQQLTIDEPMAHIIHKNQFLPHSTEPTPRVGGWNEKNSFSDRGKGYEADNKPQVPLPSNQQYHSSNEDLRKNNPAYYPPQPRDQTRDQLRDQPRDQPRDQSRDQSRDQPRDQPRDFPSTQESLSNEFSLRQKEQQLRQEGTIITIKSEPPKTPTREVTERRSADLFRDYKLKQPKESPDSRRASDHNLMGYQQAYPEFPANFSKFNPQPKVETVVKLNNNSPVPHLAYPQSPKQIPTNSRSYHSQSPLSYQTSKSPLTVPPGPSLMNPPQNWPPPPLIQQQMGRHISSPAGPAPSTSYQQHPTLSTTQMNYYPYPIPAPAGPIAVKVSQNYQPYKDPYRNIDVKEIPNRHYQPPTSSSAGQNYYHQKYPDFTRPFEHEKKPMHNDHPGRYANNFAAIDPRPYGGDMNYPRIMASQELEVRPLRDPQQQYRHEAGSSHYPNSREREPVIIHDYPSHAPEPIRHSNAPMRVNEEAYDRSRGLQPMKVERQIEEPPKIQAGPSNLPLRRPEPTEILVNAKVKIEQAPTPNHNVPSTSTSIKSAKSIFAEVKRESPLDLSVKTVKTKADSTGCDQDLSSRHRPEPSRLKFEFAPNFAKVAKTDCRQQARMGPQEYQSERISPSEKPSGSQKYEPRTPPVVAPQMPMPPQQPHASSSRNFFHDQRFPLQKNIERPRAPVPVPNNSQYPERSNYPTERLHNPMELPRPGPPNPAQMYHQKEIPRVEDKHLDVRRKNFYPPTAGAPYQAPGKPPYHSAPPHDAARPSTYVPPHNPHPRDYERERDRKYVEEILYRNRKDAPPPQHFQPIVSPPRKRIIEQHHINSSTPPKQGKVEEPPRPMHDPRNNIAMPPHHMMQRYPQYDQQRYPKQEGHPPAMGQPPALVKSELYPKPIPQKHDAAHYPKNHKEVIAIKPMTQSSYYPNPKAEMIHRSDPSGSYKQERLQFPNQNFQQRPDDNTLQLYPRINHPIQPESGITLEHQIAGPLPGTSGESSRIVNGIAPMSNGITARGADQSTILKLKTNLELKEQKKLIINKSEPGDDEQKKDLSPRPFRTKGELKGFIPVPVTFDAKTVKTVDSPALPTGQSAFDLLDWGSACNDFVQQLETGKKRIKKKRPSTQSTDKKVDEKPTVVEIPGTTTNNLSEVPKEIMKSISNDAKNSSSDEDKPLLELVNHDLKNSHLSVVEKISEKISRNIREKQRLELEQKHAARLGSPSSSENETDARRRVRTTARVRRLRKRAALGIKKTDEEQSAEEEETEDDMAIKRRHTRSLSKIDDMTSSDDEKKKNHSRDKKSDVKSVKGSRRTATPKQDSLKAESSSESSDSDKPAADKISKLSNVKNAKKLKDLGVSSFKTLLEEEETMTRSKRKLEIEKKLSNSKILRNEKVVQNVTPDKKAKIEASPVACKKTSPKRKDSVKLEDAKRKANESDSDTNASKGKKRTRRSSKLESSSSSEDSPVEEENKSERLRPRKSKPEGETPPKVSKKKIDDKPPAKASEESSTVKPSLPCQIPLSGMFDMKAEKASKFTPGWEADTYNFKRSLKIPADPQTSDTSEIFSEFVKSKDKETEGSKDVDSKGKAESSKSPNAKPPSTKKASSIIDVLLQRVAQSKKKFKAKKASNAASGSVPTTDDNLLQTPEKESEKVFGFKKNIFETSIITSRTRTENNALRKKEILKEVFGADDERPKSAPPVGAPATETEADAAAVSPEADKKISYDQKYREYLEKMNVDFSTKGTDESKEECKTADTSVKDEDDDDDDNETVVASEKDLVMPTLKGKVKKGRGRRCKGSSGFDYIRKKKRPAPNASENPLSVNNIIKKRLAAMENLENKDESDIRKEIKGWVLNKGVGESVLHKASRLDYVDVIAYCVDRLNMNPDPKDNAGYTPLHEACSRGHLEIARILLQYGANHSETALSGIRPLHEAIENGHVEIVRLLISFGADPCLATYSGQLPIAMAEDKEMETFLGEYLSDIEDKKLCNKSWYFEGPFKPEDPTEHGFEVFTDIPITKADLGSSVASVFSTSLTSLVTATTQMSDNETVASEITATPMKAPSQEPIKYQHKMLKCDTNSNNLVVSEVNSMEANKIIASSKKTKGCSVVLNHIDSMKKIKKLPPIAKQEVKPPKVPEPIQKFEEIKHKEDYDDMMVDGESDSEFLELEESEAPLPPLYLLRDEGADKWILLTDLCNLLKVKSKDAVLKQICPSSPPSSNKELIRELKMSDFLDKAICLQLFCAGEKLNVRASKVSLVRYNDSVKNLLGVQTIRMNM